MPRSRRVELHRLNSCGIDDGTYIDPIESKLCRSSHFLIISKALNQWGGRLLAIGHADNCKENAEDETRRKISIGNGFHETGKSLTLTLTLADPTSLPHIFFSRYHGCENCSRTDTPFENQMLIAVLNGHHRLSVPKNGLSKQQPRPLL